MTFGYMTRATATTSPRCAAVAAATRSAGTARGQCRLSALIIPARMAASRARRWGAADLIAKESASFSQAA